MITHTSDSHQIPSQNKTKSKLQIKKKSPKIKFWNFARNFTYATHLLKLLEKMYKYEMDPTRTVGATERTWVRDGRTDGRTEWNQYIPQHLCCAGDSYLFIIDSEVVSCRPTHSTHWRWHLGRQEMCRQQCSENRFKFKIPGIRTPKYCKVS